MNSLKRIIVSIKGQIDQVADEFENHEALANAAIKDLNDLASKTRRHLYSVNKMSEQYQTQLDEQRQQADLWSQRAIKIRQSDEQKALQCVKRLRQTQRQITFLEQQRQQSKDQAVKIQNDLNAIQEQLLALQNKKEILAARQNRAGIQEIMNDTSGNPVQDAQSIFERWEGTVVSSEIDLPLAVDSDPLSAEFEQQEDELELSSILDELTQQHNFDEKGEHNG